MGSHARRRQAVVRRTAAGGNRCGGMAAGRDQGRLLMLAKTLRDDQALAMTKIRSERAEPEGRRQDGAQLGGRIILQAPTGMGKTVIIADIVDRARQREKKVLITVPAISLIDQTIEAIAGQGIYDIGVIQADHAMTD